MPEALVRLHAAWFGIPPELRAGVSGGLALQGSADRLIGQPLSAPPWLTDMFTAFFRYRRAGRKWGMVRADILK